MVRNPRGIGKEVSGRDLATAGLRVIGQIVANVLIEVEPTLLNQLEREDRSKSFSDRTYLEPGLFPVGDAEFTIRHAVALVKQDVVSVGDQNDPAEFLAGRKAPKIMIEESL
jgi:hypothetical protein